MKHFVYSGKLSLIIFAFITITGCKNEAETPSKVADKWMNAMLKKDFKTAATYSFSDDYSDEKIVGELENFIHHSFKNYLIQDEKLFNDGKTATVQVLLIDTMFFRDIDINNIGMAGSGKESVTLFKNKIKIDLAKTEINGWKVEIPYPYKCSKADSVFHLSNGTSIGFFGAIDRKSEPIVFSEISLSICGQDTILNDFGSPDLTDHHIEVKNDTLFVKQLKELPTGKNFEKQKNIFIIEKIFFGGGKVTREIFANRQIRNYNQNEIQKVLRSFETAKQGTIDTEMDVARRLFMSTISGDNKARQYFKDFNSKFVLDGYYAEVYNDLTKMLELWDLK